MEKLTDVLPEIYGVLEQFHTKATSRLARPFSIGWP
jgi:hypothetical protein